LGVGPSAGLLRLRGRQHQGCTLAREVALAEAATRKTTHHQSSRSRTGGGTDPSTLTAKSGKIESLLIVEAGKRRRDTETRTGRTVLHLVTDPRQVPDVGDRIHADVVGSRNSKKSNRFTLRTKIVVRTSTLVIITLRFTEIDFKESGPWLFFIQQNWNEYTRAAALRYHSSPDPSARTALFAVLPGTGVLLDKLGKNHSTYLNNKQTLMADLKSYCFINRRDCPERRLKSNQLEFALVPQWLI
jgi:hypothetical protein